MSAFAFRKATSTGPGNAQEGGERRRARTTVNDLHVVLEELEASDHGAGDATQYILRNASRLELVYRARVHVFHAVVHASVEKPEV